MPHKFTFGPSVATSEEFDALSHMVQDNNDRTEEALEKLNGKVDAISGGINEALGKLAKSDASLSVRVDKIDASLGVIRQGVDRITAELGSDQFKKLKDLDVQWLKAEVEESVKDRKDYREVWAKQKKEVQAIEMIAGLRGDPEVKALIAQKGLEVHIARLDLQKLGESKLSAREALKEYEGEEEQYAYARMITNLSYAYGLMALHYKVAREHVMAVVSEKTTAEMFFEVGGAALKAALAAGLSALTGGVLGVFVPVIMDLIKQVKGSVLGASDESQTAIQEALEQHDAEKDNEERSDAIGEKGADKLSSLVFGDAKEGNLTDPYDFFLEKEVEFRKLAATIAGSRDSRAMGSKKVQLDREYTLDELKANPKWEFFFKVQTSVKELDEIWERVSQLLAVNMRRACWRAYCRSQWNNTTFSYTISVIEAKDADAEQYSLAGPASGWHYKVWDTVRLAPRHWEKICSDFRGPEDDPKHPFTVRAGRANEAFRRLETNAWISTAAVQCCQIRRPIDKIYIDLEKRSHFGGTESDPLEVPHGWTDRMLVYEARGGSVVGLHEFLRTIQTSGGVQVAISEIRFGRGSGDDWRHGFGLFRNWSKSTGKKGSLTSSNRPQEALPIVKGLNMTVMVGRKGGDGESARSGGKDAVVEVYRAKTETHSDGKPCAEVDGKQPCWYCWHTPAESHAGDEFKAKYRLVQVDVAKSGSRVIKSDGWNYQNFPTSPHDDKSYAIVPGLYCVRLDPRLELQSASETNGDVQYHVSDEWWFQILDRPDPANAPNKPEIVWKTDKGLGATEIEGTYAKAQSGDPDTPVLIHIRVDDKTYGPSSPITPSGTSKVDWKVSGIPALAGGQIVQAMATWEEEGVQTEGERMWVMGFHLSVNPTLLSGSSIVKGFCDAMEGTRIRVTIDGERTGSDLRLEGEKSKSDGRIAWSYPLGVGNVLRGSQEVLAYALPPGNTEPSLGSMPKSTVVRVLSPLPPTINPPQPYARVVTGTAMPVFQGVVQVLVDGIEIADRAVLAKMPKVGEELVEWTVSLAALELPDIPKGELGPVSSIVARIVSAPEGNSIDATERVKMPKFPVPTLDPVAAGATSVGGWVKDFPHMGIVVRVKTGTADAVTLTGELAFGKESLGGNRPWTLTKLAPLTSSTTDEKTVLKAGQQIEVRMTVQGITETSDGSICAVDSLPSPSINPFIAGAAEVSGTVTHAASLSDAVVEISVGGQVKGQSAKLGDKPDIHGRLQWKVTGMGVSLVPDAEVEVVLIRSGIKSDPPVKLPVPKLAIPQVLPLMAADKIVKGTAAGLVPATTRIQLLIGTATGGAQATETTAQIKDANGKLVWECPNPTGDLDAGYVIAAKALMVPTNFAKVADALKASESSPEQPVKPLPKPVITPKPLPGAIKVTGYIDELPDSDQHRSYVQVKTGTSDTWINSAWLVPPTRGGQVSWIVDVSALGSGQAIKARLVRGRPEQYGPESDVVTVDKPLPPVIDPLMAGATSISGRVPYIKDATISVTIHTTTGAQVLTNEAALVKAGDQSGTEQRWASWQLSNLAGLPDGKTALVAGWRVSAITKSNGVSSEAFEESRRVLVEKLKPPKIDRIKIGAIGVTGTFEGSTAAGVQIELRTSHPEGEHNQFLPFAVSNPGQAPYVWSFYGFKWTSWGSTYTVPGYADGLMKDHKVNVRALRNGEESDWYELQVGVDPASAASTTTP